MFLVRCLCFCIALLISVLILSGLHSFSGPIISVIRLITSTIGTVVCYIFWIFSQAVAFALVYSMKWCRSATDGVHSLFNWAAEFVQSLAWFLLNMVLEIVGSLVTLAGDFLLELAPKIGNAVIEVFHEATSHCKKALDLLQDVIPIVAGAVLETIRGIVEAFWTTYQDTLRYLVEKRKEEYMKAKLCFFC